MTFSQAQQKRDNLDSKTGGEGATKKVIDVKEEEGTVSGATAAIASVDLASDNSLCPSFK